MKYIIYISFIGLITGILGTVGGSILVILLKKIEETFLTFILGVSAGIMTVVVFLDLVPESIKLGSIVTTMSGMLMGVGLIGVFDFIFPHDHYPEEKVDNYYRAGLLLALGIALHNIPEGLAIGAGYSAAVEIGLGLALIIGIHNIPEGMAVATSLCLAGKGSLEILVITFLAGVPMGLGTFIGAALGNISPFFLSTALGFAAGAMLFITFDDLVPAAHQKNRGKMAIMGILLGVFLGILITNIY